MHSLLYRCRELGPLSDSSASRAYQRLHSLQSTPDGPESLVGYPVFLVDVPFPGGNKRRRVDILIRGPRIAVFVDGCFWHSCPEHGLLPKSNGEWWRRKLEGVVRRDQDTDAELTAADWLVVRVWEHDDPETTADLIERLVRERKRGTGP